MNCKLITENDCAISAVLSCSPVEFLIISKAIARCSESTDYAEADRRTMVLMSEAMKNFEQVEVADTPQTDCDKCIWSVCNYNKVDWDADTPQKELTAKCLNCHNAKACKENHWDGCIYEPQTDYDDIYPLVIIEDRYTGVYSNGKYTAWNMYFEDIPREIDEDDVTCRNFWHSYEEVVGLGDTPNEAVEDLRQKMGRVQI